MRLLLDTHVFLWALNDSERLTPNIRRIISAADAVFVSAASIWEIAIKARLGEIDADPAEVAQAIEPSGFVELRISASHAAGVAQLPMHHQDPFDRLLIAQAIAEPLRLVTADHQLGRYGDLIVTV